MRAKPQAIMVVRSFEIIHWCPLCQCPAHKPGTVISFEKSYNDTGQYRETLGGAGYSRSTEGGKTFVDMGILPPPTRSGQTSETRAWLRIEMGIFTLRSFSRRFTCLSVYRLFDFERRL